MGLSVAIALVAIAAIYFLYKNAMAKTKVIAEKAGALYRASLNKYWVDEIYDALVVEPIKWVSYFLLFRVVDVKLVDGTANGLGRLTKGLAELNKRWQTGQLPDLRGLYGGRAGDDPVLPVLDAVKEDP